MRSQIHLDQVLQLSSMHAKNKIRWSKSIFSTKNFPPVAIFLLMFLFVPVLQLDGFALMPGDLGDARLNNYFLENIFQFFTGGTDSLWHLPFFYPFPYVLGFSDNLFGSAFIYVLARLITGASDTAYQIWFFFGYVVNFGAAYYALRRMKGSVLASSIGAVIFAFVLPTTAHAGHAQLHYRFGLSLAIVFFSEFLNTKNWRLLLIAGAWFVWQFYAGVYIGFFTLLLMMTMMLTYIAGFLIDGDFSFKDVVKGFRFSWRMQSQKEKIFVIVGAALLFLLLVVLFYPYLEVTRLYGARRTWGEISVMLPRPQSYFLADASFLWSAADARVFAELPMRHEHQMFIGAMPLSLALMGFLVGSRVKNGATFLLMSGMLGGAIALTLYVGGFSIWYLFHKIPLASAIRAMTRLDQALVFPVAYLAVITIDDLRARFAWGVKAIIVLILPLLIFEFGMTTMGTSTKESWRERISTLDGIVPADLPGSPVLFFSQQSGPFFADELDSMWVSLKHGAKTMNGYSGISPPGPGYDDQYGKDCSVVPRRVLSYLEFAHQSGNVEAYRALMSRIVPVGFDNCDPAWLNTSPPLSRADRIYTEKEFDKIGLELGEIEKKGSQIIAHVIVRNSGNHAFAAISAVGKPIRLSWRFINMTGKPVSGWDARRDLPFDIPAQGTLNVSIPMHHSAVGDAMAMQVSLVQEGVFFGQDIGIQPLTVPLK
ncbi:hypothetical protein LLG90_21550 [Aromatoleum toluclasticum]|uniref:hypothetical protein n=1 Tax=Aromatoleum toluclasticum TaxID=92003 RepID=UPI001D17F133|nr:hypothetical protein [Aromatoleum toluclasticum]MCC4117944.1 hypothetical protein [Aromatoleum toluclasticum]